MSSFTDVSHVIAVRDLEAAIVHYRDVLGFEVEDRGADGWRWFIKGPISIMAGHCPEESLAAETNNHSYFLRVTMDDLDEYYESIKQAGAEFAGEIEDKPWGFREFCVRTNEGHRMVFARRLQGEV